MTNNQQHIIKKLQWIIYPVVVLMVIEFFTKFYNYDPLEATKKINPVFEFIETGIMILVFAIVSIGVLALMQQFFTKELFKPQETLGSVDASAAANAKLLLKIDAPNHLGGHLILFLTIMGFSAFVNIMLFAPEILFEKDQIARFTIFEKIIFGFFYLITHFLVIVFGQRLFKGMPPIFIATEKGFSYEPAGISTGWVLWEDVAEVKESEVLYGSGVNNGPKLVPVIGIKLINPEQYHASYAPLLQYVVNIGQKFHNYQTEGVGDILIKPSDLGDQYENVLELFKSKVKFTIDYRSMT
ncbi:MAG: hypothetical protein Q7U77_10810 [Sediminibacterium sp.]|uniref:hypothetical protein n=1 Tax=Sediminibacterium sp. TaxID=1917865 RepID=UPI00272088E7|nr:hypothetical protein [Sediminibacterium sp.]MDO8997106.1 hypothetical protein [Sediminibacterium sp.]